MLGRNLINHLLVLLRYWVVAPTHPYEAVQASITYYTSPATERPSVVEL